MDQGFKIEQHNNDISERANDSAVLTTAPGSDGTRDANFRPEDEDPRRWGRGR